MSFMLVLLVMGFLGGMIVVVSNPSPFFGAFGLVVAAGMNCGILLEWGGSFLSLILLLIYLGGMLVVFAYSTALAAEPYPESLVDWEVLSYAGLYLILVILGFALYWGDRGEVLWFLDESVESNILVNDLGVSEMYGLGGKFLMVGVGVLILTLFVVLELTRGTSRGALRVV